MLRHIGPQENILEIGTFKGEGTLLIASSGFYDHIYTCDVVDQGHQGLEYFDNITSYIKSSNDIVDEFEDGSLSVVYIDGLHEYEQVCKDIDNYLPKLKKGGWMCGHDYHKESWPDVCRAVDERFEHVIDWMDTSWCVKVGE